MAEQFVNAPAPSREEFNTLNGKITRLDSISPDAGTTNLFTIPAGYTIAFIQAKYSAGQALLFTVPLHGSQSLRQDSGFYYNGTANGGCSVSWDVSTHKITVGTPFYGGSQTTFSSIQCWAK